MSAVEQVGASPNAQSERMKVVLDAARSAITQEFQISERLDAKARNQMAVAAAWYGLVQAAASIALRANHPPLSDRWHGAIVELAIAGGAAFGLALLLSYRVWRVRDEKEITPRGLAQLAEAAQDPDRDLASDLLLHYRSILQSRRKNNSTRVKHFRRSEFFWGICVVIALAEIVLTFAVVPQAIQ